MKTFVVDKLESQRAYQRAERKITRRLGFYWHLLVFVVLNVMCGSIYLLSSFIGGGWQYPWIGWSATGLGAILLCHYLAIFVFGEEYRLRQIGLELQKKGLLEQNKGYDSEYWVAYRQAERKTRARLGFYWHIVAFLLVNFLCVLTYVLTSTMLDYWYYPWFGWPLLGLGTLLLCHYMWLALFWGDLRQRLLEKTK